jgi:hypothetical protein
MFYNFWYSLRDGFLLMIVIAFGALIVPSSAVLGLHLMTKLVPQLVPACEVRK